MAWVVSAEKSVDHNRVHVLNQYIEQKYLTEKEIECLLGNAIVYGHYKSAVCLLKYFVPSTILFNNYSLLHIAAIWGSTRIAKYLIREFKVNINYVHFNTGKNALHFAVENNNYNIVKYLICKKITNKKDKQGEYPYEVYLWKKYGFNQRLYDYMVTHGYAEGTVNRIIYKRTI